jgi:hypothetical protein
VSRLPFTAPAYVDTRRFNGINAKSRAEVESQIAALQAEHDAMEPPSLVVVTDWRNNKRWMDDMATRDAATRARSDIRLRINTLRAYADWKFPVGKECVA